MRTNNVPPRHTHFRGARVPPAYNQQPKILRFQREDLYEFLDTAVHPSKHGDIESLFPSDPRDRRMLMMDKSRFNDLLSALDSGEKQSLQRFLSEANSAIVKVGRMPEAAAAKVKDSGRFLSIDDPQAPRPTPEENSTVVPPKAPQPAKGEDLKAPIGSHGAAPKASAKDANLKLPPGALGMGQPSIVKLPELKLPVVVPKEYLSSLAQNQLPVPSGKPQGKPNTAAKDAGPKLPPGTLGMGQPSIVKLPELKLPVVVPKEYLSSLAQNQLPVPSGKPQGKPKPEAANSHVVWADLIGVDQSGKKATLDDLLATERPSRNTPGSQQDQASPLPSKRVTFATEAQVQEFSPTKKIAWSQINDSVHEMNFGPKNSPEALPKEDAVTKIAKKAAIVGAAGVAVGAIIAGVSTVVDQSSNTPDQT